MITFDEFKKIEMKVGQIMSAEPVEGSEKLLKLEVDFGEDKTRTVVSGIAGHVDLENFIGSQKVFITNLEPRAIMGIESQAMILAGKDGQGLALISPTRDLPIGTLLS
ncbi:methionine--tRNA ligase subunit beta [Candidatus Parcubacteria bacterium]|nr:methionine--tRNA ligase subunit beta [Candidatus Parcubacteria bacterium]